MFLTQTQVAFAFLIAPLIHQNLMNVTLLATHSELICGGMT